jgi:FMN-dependent NADH-azoreductase
MAAIAVSNELVDELLAADEIVIGAPMYNFSVTASLKAWIDQVVRVGRTVEYPSYVGLLKSKKVTIITTGGGAVGGPESRWRCWTRRCLSQTDPRLHGNH